MNHSNGKDLRDNDTTVNDELFGIGATNNDENSDWTLLRNGNGGGGGGGCCCCCCCCGSGASELEN